MYGYSYSVSGDSGRCCCVVTLVSRTASRHCDDGGDGGLVAELGDA